MRRDQAASLLTAAALTMTLGLVVAKNKGWTLTGAGRSTAGTPEDAIYGMLDAAKAGNVKAYLACYSGQLNDQLRQSVAESRPGDFEKYLRTSNAAIQGVALSPPEPVAGTQVKVRVEYIYRDRNEVQFIYLRNESSAWKIYQVDGAERVKTLIPYGSQVTD
jgi:hypothetical protein